MKQLGKIIDSCFMVFFFWLPKTTRQLQPYPSIREGSWGNLDPIHLLGNSSFFWCPKFRELNYLVTNMNKQYYIIYGFLLLVGTVLSVFMAWLMPIRFVSSHKDGGVVSIPVFFSMEAMFGTSSDSTLGCLFCIKQGVRGRQGVVTWLNTSFLHLESFILGKWNQNNPPKIRYRKSIWSQDGLSNLFWLLQAHWNLILWPRFFCCFSQAFQCLRLSMG